MVDDQPTPSCLGMISLLPKTSYYAISNVLSPIANTSYTNALLPVLRLVNATSFALTCHKLA